MEKKLLQVSSLPRGIKAGSSLAWFKALQVPEGKMGGALQPGRVKRQKWGWFPNVGERWWKGGRKRNLYYREGI